MNFKEKQEIRDRLQRRREVGRVEEIFEREEYKLAMSGNSMPMVMILVENSKLHKELIDEMLRIDCDERNQEYEEKQNNLAYKIFELFCSFQDDYANYMFGVSGGLDLQNNGKNYLLRMFEIFDVNRMLNETAAGYLFRIVDQVLARTDGGLLFKFIRSEQKVLNSLIKHIDTPSATNIIIKSFETYLQQITQSLKTQIVTKVFFQSIKMMKQSQQNSEKIIQGLKYFVQKILDKSTIRKIGSQCSECILSKQVVSVISSILLDEDFSLTINITCLEIIAILLKQFKTPDTTAIKARGSINKSSIHFGKCLSKVKSIQLTPESIQIIVSTLKKLISKIISRNNEMFKNKTSFILIFSHVLELMSIYIPRQLKPILNQQLIIFLLENMIALPYSNLFHSSVKQIMNIAIADQQLFQSLANIESFNFFNFLHQYFILTPKKHCFQSCLYEMINQIIRKVDEQYFYSLIEKLDFDSQWKQIVQKYQVIKENNKRKYADADEQQIDFEEIRERRASIGEQVIDFEEMKTLILVDKMSSSTAQTIKNTDSPSKQQYNIGTFDIDDQILEEKVHNSNLFYYQINSN